MTVCAPTQSFTPNQRSKPVFTGFSIRERSMNIFPRTNKLFVRSDNQSAPCRYFNDVRTADRFTVHPKVDEDRLRPLFFFRPIRDKVSLLRGSYPASLPSISANGVRRPPGCRPRASPVDDHLWRPQSRHLYEITWRFTLEGQSASRCNRINVTIKKLFIQLYNELKKRLRLIHNFINCLTSHISWFRSSTSF